MQAAIRRARRPRSPERFTNAWELRGGNGTETETPLDERIEVGLFTSEPGADILDAADVALMERRPIRSGRQRVPICRSTLRRPTRSFAPRTRRHPA